MIMKEMHFRDIIMAATCCSTCITFVVTDVGRGGIYMELYKCNGSCWLWW